MGDLPNRNNVIRRKLAFLAVADGTSASLPLPEAILRGDKDTLLEELVAVNGIPEDIVAGLSGDKNYIFKLKDSYNDGREFPVDYRAGEVVHHDQEAEYISKNLLDYILAWTVADVVLKRGEDPFSALKDLSTYFLG